MKKLLKFTITLLFSLALFLLPLKVYSAPISANAEGQDIDVRYLEEDGVIDVSSFTVASDITSVTYNDTELEFTTGSNKLTLTNLAGFVLGQTYTFVVHSDSDYNVTLKYVTKVLRTADDVRIFDIDEDDKNLDGYYVLDNDIDFGYEETVFKHSKLKTSTSAANPSNTGLSGTFDGQGHYITYKALDPTKSNGSTYGLFGMLLPGATVKNVAFFNIYVDHSSIIAYQSTATGAGHVALSNVYIKPVGGAPFGSIMQTCNCWFDMNNVVIDCEGLFATEDTPYVGAMFGYDNYGNAATGDTRDRLMKNVYVLGGIPLVQRIDTATPTYYTYYAGNQGVTPTGKSIVNGLDSRQKFVYYNVKSYETRDSMKADGNDYSSFGSEYWDVSSGTPVFKNLPDVEFSTATTKYEFTFGGEVKISLNLTVGDTSEIGVVYGSQSIENPTVTHSFLSGNGVVEIENNTVTAVKVGKAMVNFTFEGEHGKITQLIKFEVSEEPKNGKKGKGCGTLGSIGTGTGIGMGAALILCLFAAVLILRRKKVAV